ncbi:flagellar hook-associated protein FlgL [Halopseudomonas yangmingensis]|uniref:Flagellar hook-associated protein 3 FlgL n=1 Tax=Halopseudomonas yangmingensis TaxID=1720063 RepID=A0A1I4T793_9GAMM|nr:flagellar hook-associated protein FlgL [Halopseudomonas yangmingensis]SFM72569.1 flagellar hook-associated protein 3 FlgL [Halopseudomonas yangmingensis]
MRISTLQAFNTGVGGLQKNYATLTKTQQQISSGQRILTPADDPVASVRLLQLDQEAGQLQQYKNNQIAAENSLAQEETTLNSVVNILQRVREIAVQAGNGALNQQDRISLAQELKQREDELYGLFNSRNARGEYLFSGNQGKIQPFIRNPDGSYNYQGDEGQREIAIASGKMIAINDNGKSLFLDNLNVNRVTTAATVNAGGSYISRGIVENKNSFDTQFPANGIQIVFTSATEYDVLDDAGNPLAPPVSGQLSPNDDNEYTIRHAGVAVILNGEPQAGDTFTVEASGEEKRGILDTLRILREDLESSSDNQTGNYATRDAVAGALLNIDNAMGTVLTKQTEIGARLNVVDSRRLENENLVLLNQTVQSELRDLDYAEALSRLSMQTILLEASQQSFVKINGLSLFNILR